MNFLQPGQMIGGYRLISQVGQGGMAAVWKAYQASMDRYVAVKVMPFQFATQEEFLYRFRQEVHVIARLEHAHILPVYDYGESDGLPYLVMRLLEVGTLRERIQTQNMTIEEIDRIFSHLAEALEYAHRKGVIHRDIKPSNIMLDESGAVYLTDFGIAKLLEETSQFTATGAITGTPSYMSPEQAQGEKVDHRSDIYSLGVVLYEMLTGRVPFEAETPMAILLKKISSPLPPPTLIKPGFNPALEPVLLKALETQPGDRYPSMQEFLSAWKRALAEGRPETATIPEIPVQARTLAAQEPRRDAKTRPESAPRAPSTPKQRLSWLWLVAAGLFALLLAGIILEVRGGLLSGMLQGALTPMASFRTEVSVESTATIQLPQPTLTQPVSANMKPTQTLADTSTPAKEQHIIKIAILAPLSGDLSRFGEPMRRGALMAIDEWNENPARLNGMKIEAVAEDSQCEADPGIKAAAKVIEQEQVHYIIGEVCSKASIPISEIAEASGVVMISPASTNPRVTLNENGTVKKFIFRVCFLDTFQGQVAAKFSLQDLQARTAFILFDPNNSYTQGLAEAFEAVFTSNGGQLAGKATYASTDTNFSTVLQGIANARPDVVYLPDYYNIANMIVSQARNMGIQATFMGGDGWDSTGLDLRAVEGSYLTNHFSVDSTEPIPYKWVIDFHSRYNTSPDSIAALAYDATNLLLLAIQQAGTDDPAKVKDILATISYEGITGPISFDSLHNPIKSAVIQQVRDGKIQYIKTINP